MGPTPVDVTADHIIEVPDTTIALNGEQMMELRRHVDPAEICDDYGIGYYLTTRNFIQRLVTIH